MSAIFFEPGSRAPERPESTGTYRARSDIAGSQHNNARDTPGTHVISPRCLERVNGANDTLESAGSPARVPSRSAVSAAGVVCHSDWLDVFVGEALEWTGPGVVNEDVVERSFRVAGPAGGFRAWYGCRHFLFRRPVRCCWGTGAAGISGASGS